MLLTYLLTYLLAYVLIDAVTDNPKIYRRQRYMKHMTEILYYIMTCILYVTGSAVNGL